MSSLLLVALLLNPPTPIHEARYISLGGIDQWITIRGDDDRNPILLLLHGGPGDVQSPLASVYRPYERGFVLVQWDQRGSGKTYGRYRDSTPNLTLEQVAADGIALAESLTVIFPSRPIVLLGHSWGTAIATTMVIKRPKLFAAYVGTGQIASWAESVQAQFDYLRDRARATGNQALQASLDSIGRPDPTNTEQYFRFTRPLRQYLDEADTNWLKGLRSLFTDAGADISVIGDGMNFSGRALLPTQVRESFSSMALHFELPYFVIQGRDDWFTPTAPAQRYFDRVDAPRKKMVVLHHAGHFALATHAAEFSATLEKLLRPVLKWPTG